MRVVFVELDDDDNVAKTLSERDFPNTEDRLDRDVQDWTYSELMRLDLIYHFVDYEECPTVETRYYTNGKLVRTEDCINEYYNI